MGKKRIQKFTSIILAVSLILTNFLVPYAEETSESNALEIYNDFSNAIDTTTSESGIDASESNISVFGTSVYFPLPSNGSYLVTVLDRYYNYTKPYHESYLTRWVLKKDTNGHSEPYCLMDIAASANTPIYAIMDGTIYINKYLDGSGNHVVIKHTDGSYSYYGHMRDLGLQGVGSFVSAGTQIGYVGKTGAATGYHLHFEWSGHDPYCEFRAMGYNLSIAPNSAASHYPHDHSIPISNATCYTTDATNITETNATLNGYVTFSSGTATEAGVYLGTSPDNMSVIAKDSINNNKSPVNMWFGCNKYGTTLSPGTTYYYQCYAVVSGTLYKGEVKSFTTPGDIEPPVISNISVSDVTKDGYTVNCTITDNRAIGLVQFPTWTDNNGQDDLTWHTYSENMNVSSANISFRVNRSEHNNELGKYITHIYAWDQNSNQGSYQGDAIIVFLEDEAPIISNVHVINITNDGYTVYCDITDNNGIERVEFPTWTDNNGQDDLVWHLYSENVNSNSVTAWYRVKISDHNNEYGQYMTHIYAWDQNHNVTSVSIPDWQNIQPYYNYVPKDIFEYNGSVYAVYNNAMKWTDANELCKQMGGHLVSITSQSENDEIMKHLDTNENYWVGLNDFENEGVFTWSNGEQCSFTYWGDGQPDNAGDEDYVHIWYGDKWNDAPNDICNLGLLQQFGFILEIETSSIQIEKVDSFGDNKYEFYNNLMPFSVAEYYAGKQGGHLVTLSSAEENSFVASNIKGWSWLAFTDTESEGTFKWATNEEVVYTNWNEGEPNNDFNEDYGAIKPEGTWNDFFNQQGCYLVIEYDNASPKISVKSGEAKNISDTNVLLTGSVGYTKSKPDNYGFQISTERPDDSTTLFMVYAKEMEGIGDITIGKGNPIAYETSFDYYPLKPDTKYYWRAAAMIDGKRYYGETKEFKTNKSVLNEEFLFGDADADNAITASDAAFVLQKALISTFEVPVEKKTNTPIKYIDVDCDNNITASDAAFILQKALISTFELPAEQKNKQ